MGSTNLGSITPVALLPVIATVSRQESLAKFVD
jgi:hypothetical protein